MPDEKRANLKGGIPKVKQVSFTQRYLRDLSMEDFPMPDAS